jgi:hypothetical protein
MLAMSSGIVPSHVFNPDISGLVSIEKITVLQHYGGIAWDGGGGASPTPAIISYYLTLLAGHS